MPGQEVRDNAHGKANVQGRSVFHPHLCPVQTQSPEQTQSPGHELAFKYRLSSIKPVKTLQVFPLQPHNTANSTDQVRKIRSRLSTLFFRGYKSQVDAGCICQHVKMPSTGVHGSVACLKSYLCVIITFEHSPTWRCWWRHRLNSYNYVPCLWRGPGVLVLFWTSAGCSFSSAGPGEGAAEEIYWAMLSASCADHKQSKHMFFIALLSCYLLPSFLWSTVLWEHWEWLLLNQ